MKDSHAEPLLIALPKIEDPRGNLSFVQYGGGRAGVLPFEIERVYWVYDVPGGETHLGRALKTTTEAIIAMSGSFDVETDCGDGEMRRFTLNRSYNALIVPPGCWRRLGNFSTNAVAMVVASAVFSENDYIRDYTQFRKS